MKNNCAHFISDAMNPPENMDKYVTTNMKAVNFGIYAADLAYSTVFEKNQSSLSYFKNVKKMAESLGLSEGFDEIMSKRIDKTNKIRIQFTKSPPMPTTKPVIILRLRVKKNCFPIFLSEVGLKVCILLQNPSMNLTKAIRL